MLTILASFTPTIQGIVVCTGRGLRSNPTAWRPTHSPSGDGVCFGRLVVCQWRFGRQERSVIDRRILIPRRSVSFVQFEHRKHKGCAILLMSCSGALCQIHLEIDLTKDQLLETVPRCHAVRHGNRNRGTHSAACVGQLLTKLPSKAVG